MQIGIDIQDTNAIKKLMKTSKLARIFTARELAYIETKSQAPETVTGLWCAKEAFFKALGFGVGVSQLLAVEVDHAEQGAPFYLISEELTERHSLKNAQISLSISHTKSTAAAVCVINRA